MNLNYLLVHIRKINPILKKKSGHMKVESHLRVMCKAEG